MINLFGLENDSFIHSLLLDKPALYIYKKRMNEMKEMSNIIVVVSKVVVVVVVSSSVKQSF